jgi:hypothetical protein
MWQKSKTYAEPPQNKVNQEALGRHLGLLRALETLNLHLDVGVGGQKSNLESYLPLLGL